MHGRKNIKLRRTEGRREDGETNMTKLNIAFSSFGNAFKNKKDSNSG